MFSTEDCPTLKMRCEKFYERDVAMRLVLNKRALGVSMSDAPSRDDALAMNHHRNILMLLHKIVYTNLLPFVFDDISAVNTYKTITDCFTQEETRIRELIAEALALLFDGVETYVKNHQVIQSNFSKPILALTTQPAGPALTSLDCSTEMTT